MSLLFSFGTRSSATQGLLIALWIVDSFTRAARSRCAAVGMTPPAE